MEIIPTFEEQQDDPAGPRDSLRAAHYAKEYQRPIKQEDLHPVSSSSRNTQRNLSEAQALLNKLTAIMPSFGMRLAPSKCKVLLQNVPSANVSLTVQGEPLEIVENFTYLGSCISSDGSVSDEVGARISKARITFANLRHLWRQKGISLDLKGRVYQATSLDRALPVVDRVSHQQLLPAQFVEGVQSALSVQLRLARAIGQLSVEVVHLAPELGKAPLATLWSKGKREDSPVGDLQTTVDQLAKQLAAIKTKSGRQA
ncbi:hypothetical protein T265_05554 [Opisthorchis viverrini]|uniref:Uncharacterized protein n=1 Tax=Opisthorchis viverrini TaxID=6198 RepID=A0A074ZJ65_OPIVI|nr:hypothetical protein T265_05554 [Opisthorchis viverrini]KER27378.1 hypothetical protein T265_05554 [Opisthorchis viverrini]